jgi:hypothetical protein
MRKRRPPAATRPHQAHTHTHLLPVEEAAGIDNGLPQAEPFAADLLLYLGVPTAGGAFLFGAGCRPSVTASAKRLLGPFLSHQQSCQQNEHAGHREKNCRHTEPQLKARIIPHLLFCPLVLALRFFKPCKSKLPPGFVPLVGSPHGSLDSIMAPQFEIASPTIFLLARHSYTLWEVVQNVKMWRRAARTPTARNNSGSLAN